MSDHYSDYPECTDNCDGIEEAAREKRTLEAENARLRSDLQTTMTAERDLRTELAGARRYAEQLHESLRISNRKLSIVADIVMAREEADVDAAMEGEGDGDG